MQWDYNLVSYQKLFTMPSTLLTFNGNVRHIQSNIALLQKGASLIRKKELEIGMLICKRPNANVYEAVLKNMVCAVTTYKRASFSEVWRNITF